MADKRLYRYTVKLVARFREAERIAAILERSIGATAVEVQARLAPERSHGSVPTSPNWKPRTGSVAAKVIGLLSERGPLRLTEITQQIGATHTASAVYYLLGRGAIKKVARGCYALPGVQVKKIPSLDRLGPGLTKIYSLLQTPRTAVQLRLDTHVSRQAVEQTLKRLMKRKLVRRIDAIGERGEHVYLRTDKPEIDAILARMPVLRENLARVLSRIPHDSSARLKDIVSAGPSGLAEGRAAKQLVALGLVDLTGRATLRLVRLTSKGRQHPQYHLDAAKAPPVAQTVEFDAPLMEVFLAIHAMAPVRALDITLATGVGRDRGGRGTGTGNYIQRLEQSGYVEAITTARKGHPQYRLTKAGMAFIESLRGQVPFPDEAELRANLKRERDVYLQSARERSAQVLRHSEPVYGERSTAIVSLLRKRGPLPTTQINSQLPNPYPNPRSIHLAMKLLAARGEVVALRQHDPRTKTPILWGALEVETPSDKGLPMPQTSGCE